VIIRVRVVCIEQFWQWAKKNRSLIDFSKLEENILGAEPEWVKKQRKLDYQTSALFKVTPWTDSEDRKLLLLLKEYKYTYVDLSKKLNRTTGAIQRRIAVLQPRERPIEEDNQIKWTDEECIKLIELINQGAKYPLIADKLTKNDEVVRSKVYHMFKTKNLDKVREILKKEDDLK